MTKTADIIADHLYFQANHLDEKSFEYPESKAENDAATKALGELENLFRNGDCDPDLISRFDKLFEDELDGGDFALPGTQAYRRLLEDVGFGAHFSTADDFLAAAIAAMELKSKYSLYV